MFFVILFLLGFNIISIIFYYITTKKKVIKIKNEIMLNSKIKNLLEKSKEEDFINTVFHERERFYYLKEGYHLDLLDEYLDEIKLKVSSSILLKVLTLYFKEKKETEYNKEFDEFKLNIEK